MGDSLRTICAEKEFPDRSTVIRWKNSFEAFRSQYARARDDQAELWADEINDIADDGSNDFMEREGKKILREEHVQRSRLRVDSRKWLLSKLRPGTYGDKVQHANAAGDGNTEVIYRWDTPKPE
jgi:hypothetical protein